MLIFLPAACLEREGEEEEHKGEEKTLGTG